MTSATLVSINDTISEFLWDNHNCIDMNGFKIKSGINLWVCQFGNSDYDFAGFPFQFTNYPKTPQQMDEFVKKVNTLDPGMQVAIILYDGFLSGMQDTLLPAFQSLGSQSFQEAQLCQNYCMIGRKGGSAIESYGDDPFGLRKIRVNAKFEWPDCWISN
ncbi:hypothetical protein DFA_11477 [Cavenderia fasciculata]|uniref:ILEI/PANDER domain-containing protein n=1 Tax=Cavenderia fasciculata TaxID=261658 RepID=F4QD35_CACFS|nr:uncharacterized protein DFA_11477 [Cavenderia fasciculata]EGG13716.1 hypothetical protein DFA_11477 [Cavenderia fasciculata]|eukprot:XP_004350420.1 hypothetical protein DFA_11477 [Cavenderia fasciculata]